jgi:hypothetical protein
MKKVIIIIAMAISMSLQADLLHGPFSAESQELVKLAQNRTAPIPENLKKRSALIELFRSWFSSEYIDASSALINGPVSLEAAVQVIMLTPLKSWAKDLSKQHLTHAFFLARAQRNKELLALVIKEMPQKDRDSLLETEILELFVSLYDKKEYEDEKEAIKIIIANSGTSDDVIKKALNKAAASILLQKDIEEPLDFLLSLGLPINYISPDATKQETLLDIVNNMLLEDKLKNDQDLLKTQKYLQSKGAKTSQELSQAK